ncbi:hypothetical protein ACKUSY_12790 [Myroides odoratus]
MGLEELNQRCVYHPEGMKNQEYLLNKVNPVGGKYNLNSEKGMSLFMEKAKEVAKKYNLPTKF